MYTAHGDEWAVRSSAGEGNTRDVMSLEQLPAVGSPRKPTKPAAPVTSRAGDEHLEELPPAPEDGASEWSDPRTASAGSRPSAHISVHPMRELLELAADDQPAVAVEDGVYRVQAHAYGVVPGRDPGLRRLAAAVIGGTADAGDRAGDDLPVRRDEGDALQVTEHGIELDAFTAGVGGDEPIGVRGGPLDRLGRRVDAVGAALLVHRESRGFQPRRVTGILSRTALQLAFADEDPVACRYLARRVALVAEDPFRMIPELQRHFPSSARDRIGRLAFLPARAGGEPAYLMLAGAKGEGAWDVHALVGRLGLVGAAGPRGRTP